MRRRARYPTVFVLSLAVFDLVVAGVAKGSRLPDRVIDLQHPTTLLAKLDRLRTAPSPKVVLLGDSLVYGGVLGEHGDCDWRKHELGSRLVVELRGQWGVEPFVMNLGMNGALPADLEVLAPLLAACEVDWIVLDINLRSFSTDFSAPEHGLSRPWLRDLSTGPDSRVRWRPGRGIDGWLAGHLADHSALMRYRGLFQDNVLSALAANEPIWGKPGARSDLDAEVRSLVQLGRLKNRLKSVDLTSAHPQVAAIERLLAGFAARGQRHVVFYAKENPDQLSDVMEPAAHRAGYERVASLVRDAQGPSGVFVPPVSELRPDHFLDFTHLNAEGYQVLARQLAAAMK